MQAGAERGGLTTVENVDPDTRTLRSGRERAAQLSHGWPEAHEAQTPRVSVVIPAKNEARNLPFVLTRLPCDLHEVILVNGQSSDRTVDIARQLYPDILVVEQSGRGKGNALMCGFKVCTGDIIVMLDADGSADAAEIPRFVAGLCHGADFAKGSRFASGGGSTDITVLRRLGNKALTTTVNLLFGSRYTDLCYGYNAFWAHCLPYIDVDCEGFEVETLINIRLAKADIRVHEVPSFEHGRVHGVSNLNAARDGLRVLRTIVAERFQANHCTALSSVSVPHGYGWDGVERRTQGNRRLDGVPWSHDLEDLSQHRGRRSSDRTVLSHSTAPLGFREAGSVDRLGPGAGRPRAVPGRPAGAVASAGGTPTAVVTEYRGRD